MADDVFQVVIHQTDGIGRKTRTAPETQIPDPSAFEQVFDIGELAVIVYLQRSRQYAR